MKRIISLMLCFFMVISLVGCGSDGNGVKTSTPTKVDTSLKKGRIAPQGDVFELPKVKQATGAPIITEVTKQVYPGESIVISGEGFKAADLKMFVYAQNQKDNGKAKEAKFTVIDDNYVSVLIDEKLDYGVYGIYAQTAAGTSNIATVNKPEIWQLGFYKATAGETLTVLGQNLTNKNGDKTHAYIVSENGKQYCEAFVSFADAGKIELIVPEGLTSGQRYKIRVHNGHGGEAGFAESPDFLEYVSEAAVQFGGKLLNVEDFGADPASLSNDDSKAVQDAVRKAQDGDIIYFPPGSYLLKSQIVMNVGVKIIGAGVDKTKIYAGYNIDGYLFDINCYPTEVTGIRFEQIRTKGKLKGGFIDFQGDGIDNGCYKIYVHNNSFYQYVKPTSRSEKQAIKVFGTCGVRVEDNYFDASGAIFSSNCSKAVFKNNEADISIYTGTYYAVACVFFTGTQFLDISNNRVWGKGAPKDGPGELNVDDFTTGRVFCLQGFSLNVYIAHNDVKRCGITNANAGELILYENMHYFYDGPVETADANSVTVTKQAFNKAVVNSTVTVTSGKGRGQYRIITKRLGQQFMLDRPWDIVPDSTSRVLVNLGFRNAYLCDNVFDGHTNWASDPGSTMGIQVYGSTHNIFFCRNKMKNMPWGISVTPFYSPEYFDFRCPIVWSQFDHNTIENCGIGVDVVMTTSATSAENVDVTFGCTYKGNNITKMSDYTNKDWVGKGGVAFNIGSKQAGKNKWKGNWITANLFESNTIKDCPTEFYLGLDQGKNLFRNNKTRDKESDMILHSDGGQPIKIKY